MENLVKISCERNAKGEPKIGSGRKPFYTGTLKAMPKKGTKLRLKRDVGGVCSLRHPHVQSFVSSKIVKNEKVSNTERRITTEHGSVYVVAFTDPAVQEVPEVPVTQKVDTVQAVSTMPLCPVCGSSEGVSLVKGTKTKYLCSKCEKTFLCRKKLQSASRRS